MKKLICILSLSGVMGCTDLTENMYNDLNKTNFTHPPPNTMPHS